MPNRRATPWTISHPATPARATTACRGAQSLIGAIVAEFAAGTAGTSSGLAYRILEAGYRLNIPRMFAAVLLVSVVGIVIFMTFTLLAHLILHRWHESALRRER